MANDKKITNDEKHGFSGREYHKNTNVLNTPYV